MIDYQDMMKCLWKGVADTDQQMDAADRIEELEAKLAKAADVIEWALICGDEHQVRDWVHDAINVLSELTGGPKNGNE